MSTKYKVGDKVQLVSGGPKMTVSRVMPQDSLDEGENPQRYECHWFDSKKTKLSTAVFAEAELQTPAEAIASMHVL